LNRQKGGNDKTEGEQTDGPADGDNQITAIDILLEPDATMLEPCIANNARL